METIIILNCFFSFPNFWVVISLLLAIFAVILCIFRPRISCDIYNEENLIKVRLFNINKHNKIITDIHCEMSLSGDPNFIGLVETLDLEKDWIVCLMKPERNIDRNYVFKQRGEIQNLNHTHLRIRFLISNYIGIKKAYEKIIPLVNIPLTNIIIGKPR